MIVGRDRSFMLVLFVVATMIAGPGLLRGANAEVPPVRSIAHSSEETKPLECELIRLLSEATGAHKTPTLECFFKKSRCDSLCDERCGGLFYEVPQGDSPRIHTLVAMVADPRQSQMALYFDQSLEALVSAAAKSGFLKDRFFLPWKSAATQGATGADYDGPGLMLFRSDREGRLEELLIVFLVGESPVLGAQRDDLNQAFRLADAVMTDQTAPLRVLGPFFSGSASSLARELAQLPDQNIERSAYVITGTATASTIDSAFKQVKNIEFYRTVAQDDELMAFLQDEICRQQPDARFALLSEIGTVYGNAFEKKEDEKTEYNSATAPHDEDSPEEYRECKRRPLTVFGFPLHISSLRAVRERTQDSAQAQVPTLRNTLELHLAPEEEGTRDMPPLFSTLAPYDVELALRQLLQRIGSEDDLTHVAIVATDPADVLFLGNEIRKCYWVVSPTRPQLACRV